MAYTPNTIVNTATVYPYQNRQLDTTDPVGSNVSEGVQQAALMKMVKADGTAVASLTPVAIALPTGVSGTTTDSRN